MGIPEALLIIAFFCIAFVYASAGFGGGSSYLALMALAGIGLSTLKATALLCNMVVVTGNCWVYYRQGLHEVKKNWGFFLASVPMAFIGGLWKLEDRAFFILLGITLLLAAAVLWIRPKENDASKKRPLAVPLAMGGSIGFLSGLVSIGGGIFLAPLLHLWQWDTTKKIAALASLFILVNSASGLAGQLQNPVAMNYPLMFALLTAVLMGGQLGSRWGALNLSAMHLKRITAILVSIAGLNILSKHL
jgi:hypothetical protein